MLSMCIHVHVCVFKSSGSAKVLGKSHGLGIMHKAMCDVIPQHFKEHERGLGTQSIVFTVSTFCFWQDADTLCPAVQLCG